jgi:hypothetical protein
MAPKNLTLKIGHPDNGGFAGVNFSASNNKMKANQSPQCSNYLVNKKGLITRKGSLSQNVVEVEAGTNKGFLGMTQFYNGTSYNTLAKCGTTLYNVSTTEAHTALATGLSDKEIFFDKWLGNYFFIDNNTLYKGDQDDMTAVAVTLYDEGGKDEDDEEHSGQLYGEKPYGTIPILHNGRLWWIGGHSTPFFSEIDYWDRYLTMDDKSYLACSVSCDEGDGQDTVAGLSYNGKLIVWKRQKMFFIVGDYDEQSGSLPEVIMYTSTGVYNQKGVIRCGDGFIRGYGPDGVFEYSDATGLKFISADVKDELNKIDFTNRDLVCCGWVDGLFLLFYPINSDTNNRCLAYDPTTKDWFPIDDWYVSCLATFEDDWLYAGWATSGYVKKLFEGYNDDGATIPTYYETKFIVLPAEYYMDKLIAGISNGDGEVKITWICDTSNSAGIAKGAREVDGVRLADEDRPDLGGFMLSDEDNLGDDYLIDEAILDANFSEYRARMRPGLRFKKIKFIFESDSADEHQIDYLEAYLVLARTVV